MENRTILVVDDEPKLVEVVKSYLENDGYTVASAYTGKDALEIFDRVSPILVILDLMLPDLSGEEICISLRKKSRVPILMLTAKADEEHILNGLNLGADDYLTKPFSPRLLVARVKAILRRVGTEPVPLSNLLSFNQGELVIDSLRHEVKKNGELVFLTPNEYRILMTLVKYPTKAFTREELILSALGDDYDGFNRVIDTHIKNIRQKLENDTRSPHYILTVHGIGYKFGGDHH